MAQRTVFPAIPNTAEAQYPVVLQSIFGELARRGGTVPFKQLRPWLKEQNIYNKEEVEELFHFLGCHVKPDFVIGDFGKQYLACKAVAEQKELLYRWVAAWNPFLVKYVFEALDVDGGGRLHSTHELYRLITSYVYPGEYVTLPNFQNWIRWMAATGYIKYIGIRWGMSELGKGEMTAIRQIDVDELLEDEEDERATADSDEEHSASEPAIASPPVPAWTAQPAPPAGGDELPEAGELEDELPPDMPPEAPVPAWRPEPSEAEPAQAAPPTTGLGTSSAITVAPPPPAGGMRAAAAQVKSWVDAYPRGEGGALSLLGLCAEGFRANPELSLFKASAAALLAERHAGAAWTPLYRFLDSQSFFDRYFGESLAAEQVLAEMGWLVDRADYQQLLGDVLLPLMQARAGIKGHRGLARKLEALPDPARLLELLSNNVFGGRVSAAALWMYREMVLLDLWGDPGFPS